MPRLRKQPLDPRNADDLLSWLSEDCYHQPQGRQRWTTWQMALFNGAGAFVVALLWAWVMS